MEPSLRTGPQGLSFPAKPSIQAALVTAGVTIFAAWLRLRDLARVPQLIFDETYYAKDAWSLRQLGYEGRWPAQVDLKFAAGDTSGLSEEAAFVVHPPLGKWLIASTMVGDVPNAVGWRFAAAIAGTIGVTLLCLLVWTLFRSVPAAALAGLFLATDGMHLVMSRVALLDVFLTTFCLAALYAVARDHAAAKNSWWRPWLVTAGFFLGCAAATKWSGIYLLAALGLLVFGADMVRNMRGRTSGWFLRTIADGTLAFLYLVGTAAVTYLVSWAAWFNNPNAWGKTGGGTALTQWWRYQTDMWNFHVQVGADHPYRSKPATWLLQLRPTSFWFQKDGGTVSTVLALGNPALWWAGVIALLVLLAVTIHSPHWRYWLIWAGFAGLYLPWFLYPGRTVFTFYSVVFAPLVALLVAWMIVAFSRANTFGGRVRAARLVLATLTVVVILGCSWWMWPVWVGTPLTPDGFTARMWLRSWI